MKVVAFLLALTASNAAAFNHCDFECRVDCCAPGESRYSLFGSCDYECLDRCFVECESGGRSLRGVADAAVVENGSSLTNSGDDKEMSTDNGVVNQRTLYDLSYKDCIYGCIYSTNTYYDFNICKDECRSGGRSLSGDNADASSLTSDDKEVSTDADVVANNGGDGKGMSTDEVVNQRALYSPPYDDCVRFCGYSADTDEEFYECADYCEVCCF